MGVAEDGGVAVCCRGDGGSNFSMAVEAAPQITDMSQTIWYNNYTGQQSVTRAKKRSPFC